MLHGHSAVTNLILVVEGGNWVRPYLCKLARHGPWPVRNGSSQTRPMYDEGDQNLVIEAKIPSLRFGAMTLALLSCRCPWNCQWPLISKHYIIIFIISRVLQSM